jgi:hypothetical protein
LEGSDPNAHDTRENRARIVEAASRLFREKGFDGVGLDAIMNEVGLPHLELFFGQCDADAGAGLAATLRSSGTSSVATMNAIMIARKASA